MMFCLQVNFKGSKNYLFTLNRKILRNSDKESLNNPEAPANVTMGMLDMAILKLRCIFTKFV